MATINDLFEVTGIFANTTYSVANGNLLGVVDGLTSTALDDGEFDIGDQVQIGGVSYSITQIQEPSNAGLFRLGNGTDIPFAPGSESNLDVVFLTVSNGGTTRYFIIPNDSFGNMRVAQIVTGNLNNVAGSDAAIISTANNDVQVVCFVGGTLIETPGGDVAVEKLRIGDHVITRDNGAQAIRAILLRALDLAHSPDRLRPIAFERDSLGPGRPQARLCVSPQHRMLVTDPTGAALLVPAKALLPRRGVRVMRGKRHVTYHHLVFSRHEIIHANCTPTESFFPGPMALHALCDDRRAELHDIFGPILPAPARAAAPILRYQDAKRRAMSFC